MFTFEIVRTHPRQSAAAETITDAGAPQQSGAAAENKNMVDAF